MKEKIKFFLAITMTISILVGGFIAMVIVVKADSRRLPEFDNGRFEIVEQVDIQDYTEWYVIVDRQTGVEYLFIYAGGVRSISPLYNADGTVSIRGGK